jgi:hypothetical protein
MMVSLTLSPSSRKDLTAWNFVSKLHFFDLDDVVLAASIFIFLQALEFELAVVHDPGYRRLRLGRDLHKVHFPLDRESLCAVDRHHA